MPKAASKAAGTNSRIGRGRRFFRICRGFGNRAKADEGQIPDTEFFGISRSKEAEFASPVLREGRNSGEFRYEARCERRALMDGAACLYLAESVKRW